MFKQLSSHQRLTFISLSGLVLYFAIEFASVWVSGEKFDWGVELKKAVDFVALGLITFFCTTVLFEFYSKKASEENVEKAINSFLQRDDYFTHFSQMEREPKINFLKRAFLSVGGSLLNPTKAEIIWAHLISNYVPHDEKKQIGFRKNFSYTIRFFDVKSGDAMVKHLGQLPAGLSSEDFAKKHVVSRQTIRYAKYEGDIDVNGTGIVEAHFTSNLDELHELMKKGSVYFRENLLIDDAYFAAIRAMSPEKLEEWIRKGWEFEARCPSSTEKLTFKAEFTKAPEGLGISILIDRSAYPGEPVTMSFGIPYLRAEHSYLVMLPEPVEEPEIDFQMYVPGFVVAPFAFFGSAKAPDLEPDYKAKPTQFKVRTKGWVFPRSGVMFTWRECSDAQN